MLRCSNRSGIEAPPHSKVRLMSPQLTVSSLFSVLALAALCVTASARELAGYDAPVVAEQVVLAGDQFQG
jgi:hypothetical protein